MTNRERNLLVIFLIALISVALVVGLSSYLEALTRLDAEFVALQKHVLQIAQGASGNVPSASISRWGDLRERFFTPGKLQDPLTLASRVQTALKASDLVVLESRVTENTGTSQWIQYRAEGQIDSWFRFLQLVRSQDAKTLFRTVSLAKKQGFIYAVAFEVGHVAIQ